MHLDYHPGGRWVRLLSVDRWTISPVGRWHLALDEPAMRPSSVPVALVCGRELRTTGIAGGEIASITALPQANACPVCERTWVREQHPTATRGARPALTVIA